MPRSAAIAHCRRAALNSRRGADRLGRALLQLSYLGKIAPQHVQRVFLRSAEIAERDMVEQHFEGVADMAELPAIAADLVENRLLHLRTRRLAEIDVDEAELRPLLIERPGVDRLP